MKKSYQYILIYSVLLILVLSSCSKAETETAGESSILLLDAYSNLTDGKFKEAIEKFSTYKTNYTSSNISVEMGMGKAYLGMEDYENAVNAFKNAYEIDSDGADIIHYLGIAQMSAEDYSGSAESFRKLLEKNPDDKILLTKLEDSLRKGKEHTALYEFLEERIEKANDDNEDADEYIGRLLEVAQLIDDEDFILSAMENFKDTEQYYAIDIAYKASKLLLSGDEEGAKNLLFDAEIIESLIESSNNADFYFGEFDDSGEYHGKGIRFVDDNNESSCTIFIGEFANYKLNGLATKFIGSNFFFVDEEKQIGITDTTRIESNWKDNQAEGFSTKVVERTRYEDGLFNYSYKSIYTANCISGISQGEVWAEYHDKGGSSIRFTKHFVVDGLPVSFETESGKMVYELHYQGSKDATPYSISTEKCTYCEFSF